MKQCPSLVA